MPSSEKLVITGASGQLGRLVIAEVQRQAPTAHLIGVVRNPAAAQDLADAGVELRVADYKDPESLTAALEGADKVLLISSSDFDNRVQQHCNVIDAAKAAKIKLLAYTSVLNAAQNPMLIAQDHKKTEEYIRELQLPSVILRNGWYTENYTAQVGLYLQHGALIGAAKDGRISFAARADYAAAAATVLTARADEHVNKVYELAGDQGVSLAELAAEITQQSETPVAYQDMPAEVFKGTLQEMGLPEPLAVLLSDSDTNASEGALYDDSQTLSQLIGRPTTPVAESLASAIAGLKQG